MTEPESLITNSILQIQTYLSANDPRSALKTTKKTLRKLETLLAKKKMNVGNHYIFFKMVEGDCFYALNEPDKALLSYKSILEKFRLSDKDAEFLAMVHNKIGRTYVLKGETENGMIEFAKAKSYYQTSKKYREAYELGMSLLKYNLSKNDFNSAKQLLKELKKLNKKDKEKDRKNRNSLLLEFYEISIVEDVQKQAKKLSNLVEKARNIDFNLAAELGLSYSKLLLKKGDKNESVQQIEQLITEADKRKD